MDWSNWNRWRTCCSVDQKMNPFLCKFWLFTLIDCSLSWGSVFMCISKQHLNGLGHWFEIYELHVHAICHFVQQTYMFQISKLHLSCRLSPPDKLLLECSWSITDVTCNTVPLSFAKVRNTCVYTLRCQSLSVDECKWECLYDMQTFRKCVVFWIVVMNLSVPIRVPTPCKIMICPALQTTNCSNTRKITNTTHSPVDLQVTHQQWC